MKYSWSILVLVTVLSLGLIVRNTKAGKAANVAVKVPPAPKGPRLESKTVIEPGCVARKAITELKPEFINKVAAWYVPIAAKYFYYHWGEALINRSLGATEFPSLCMKWLFLAPTQPLGKYNVIVGGYHQAVTQLCAKTGLETQTCEAVKGAPDYHKGGDNVATIVATDNKRWFLLVRCVQKKYRDWAIFTADKKTIDDALLKKLTGVVKEHGFDVKHLETSKYDKCPPNV